MSLPIIEHIFRSFTDISYTDISAAVIVPCDSFFVKSLTARNDCYSYKPLPSYGIDQCKYCWLVSGFWIYNVKQGWEPMMQFVIIGGIVCLLTAAIGVLLALRIQLGALDEKTIEREA